MSDRPTPETDAVASIEGDWDTIALRVTSHARKLEPERDEVREAFVIATDQMVQAQSELREVRAIAAELAVIASHCLGSHRPALIDTAPKIAAALKRWKERKNEQD